MHQVGDMIVRKQFGEQNDYCVCRDAEGLDKAEIIIFARGLGRGAKFLESMLDIHPNASLHPYSRKKVLDRIPSASMVVDVAGGQSTDLMDIYECAIRNGKKIVSANKELLAIKYQSLLRREGSLFCEASVCAMLPIFSTVKHLIRTVKADPCTCLAGIVNGSTNYLLTELYKNANASVDSVIMSMRDLGYLEADPTKDLEGYDAMYKIMLLASEIFEFEVPENKVLRLGLQGLQQEDLQHCKFGSLTLNTCPSCS